MMASYNVLITGASGYLGGSILYQLQKELPSILQSHKLYALVRSEAQAEGVNQYGVEPISFSIQDEQAVHDAVLKHHINVVFYLLGVTSPGSQIFFIKALSELKKKTGQNVHFLHTTGAKVFSSHAGAPTDEPLLDTDPDLYNIQKKQKAKFSMMQSALETNNSIIEISEEHGVKSYIYAPCIVYGKGLGFGNPISIQTAAIVKAAKKAKRVYRVDQGRTTWPVSHISDTSNLYIALLRSIVSDEDPPHGKQGYYLASSGSVAWEDIYTGIAQAMHTRGLIDTDQVEIADAAALAQMGQALNCPPEAVPVQLGGLCKFTAKRGAEIGWQSKYAAAHIVEAMDDEVGLILDNLKS